MVTGRIATILVLIAAGSAGCDDLGAESPEAELATNLCGALEEGQPIQHRAAITDAIDTLEEEGLDGAAFYDAVTERCEDAFLAASGLDPEDDLDPEELSRNVDFELESCGSRSATGTITNNSRNSVRVTVEVRFTDEDEVLLHTGTDSVQGVRPSETARWEVGFFGDGYDRCNASVESVLAD